MGLTASSQSRSPAQRWTQSAEQIQSWRLDSYLQHLHYLIQACLFYSVILLAQLIRKMLNTYIPYAYKQWSDYLINNFGWIHFAHFSSISIGLSRSKNPNN